MSSKAEKTSQDLHQQHLANIFFRNPTLLKIVAWLSSLSIIGVTGVVWADLKPISAIETQAPASLQVAPKATSAATEREVFGPPLPTAQRTATAPIRADRLPNREVPVAVAPASAAISPTGTIVRPQHTDLLTADNFIVGVNGTSAGRPATEEFIEIAVPAPLSKIVPTRNVEAIAAANSNVRPNPIVKQSVPVTSLKAQSQSQSTPTYQTVPKVSNLPAIGSMPLRTGRTTPSEAKPGLKPTVIAPIKPAPVAPTRSTDNLATLPTASSSVRIDVPAPLTGTIPVPTVARLPQIDRGGVVPSVPAIPTVRPASANQSKPLAFANTPATNQFNSAFIYPLTNPAQITSSFGWRTHPITGSRRFHSGVDIGAPMGAPIVATGSGTIVSAGWLGGYGKAIVIQHNGVLQTLYGHLSEVFVQPGQQIEQGTVIGRVGSTGNSTGPHLHFETRTATADGWVAVDPRAEVEYALDNLRRSMPFAQRDVDPGIN